MSISKVSVLLLHMILATFMNKDRPECAMTRHMSNCSSPIATSFTADQQDQEHGIIQHMVHLLRFCNIVYPAFA